MRFGVIIGCLGALGADALSAAAPGGAQKRGEPPSIRVLVAEVGQETVWFPGDRRRISDPSPSQAAALRGAALELAVGAAGAPPPLVCMLPATGAGASQTAAAAPGPLAGGGGGRLGAAAAGAHGGGAEELRLARRFAPRGDATLAALCAVRSVRSAGRTTGQGSVELRIESAVLEVVGRVSVRSLGMLRGGTDEADSAGGSSLVASLAPRSAIVDDAWIDELESSPVHAIHRLRPYADECTRHHAAILAACRRLRELGDPVDRLSIDTERPLAELAGVATRAGADATKAALFDLCLRPRLLDAYGDVVEPDDEVAYLSALSFAAWRTLRPPHGPATPDQVLWAFQTRSTLERLARAEQLLAQDKDVLEARLARWPDP